MFWSDKTTVKLLHHHANQCVAESFHCTSTEPLLFRADEEKDGARYRAIFEENLLEAKVLKIEGRP